VFEWICSGGDLAMEISAEGRNLVAGGRRRRWWKKMGRADGFFVWLIHAELACHVVVNM
jgi:hypothetical protein